MQPCLVAFDLAEAFGLFLPNFEDMLFTALSAPISALAISGNSQGESPALRMTSCTKLVIAGHTGYYAFSVDSFTSSDLKEKPTVNLYELFGFSLGKLAEACTKKGK